MFFAAVFTALIFSACKNDAGNSGGQETDGVYDIIMPESTPHGTLSVSRLTARKNTQIIITAFPDKGYDISWVKYNGNDASRSGDQFTFAMPAADVIITAEFTVGGTADPSYDIFSEGELHTPLEWEPESDGDWGTDIVIELSIEETAGVGAGTTTKAIKIDVTKMKNYFALRLPLGGMGVNFKDVDGLTLWAKAGTKSSPYVRYPAINRVAFGDYTDYNWVKSVWYCGENVPNTGYIPLTTAWQQITVPVPARIDHEINAVTLFFTEDQVQGQIIYIDRISFIQADDSNNRELVQIVLPSTGSIPYKTNTGSPLASDLERLTRATRFVYQLKSTRYTLYGEDPADGADAFLNRMSDFYNDIKYFAGDNNQVPGKTYTPSAAGAAFNLSVSYGAKSSLNNVLPNGTMSASRMAVTVKELPATAGGGALIIDDLEKVTTVVSGQAWLVQLPFYWGGTAGDAQSYGDKILYCWVDNIMQNPMPLLDTGIPMDAWYVVGNMDVNCDLTGTAKIVIGAKLSTGVKYTFSLSSGYTGAASTLKPDGGKYSKQITMTGQGFTDFKDYVFNLADFTGDSGFDPTNVTAYEFFIDPDLNAGNEASFAAADPCFLQVSGIKATN